EEGGGRHPGGLAVGIGQERPPGALFPLPQAPGTALRQPRHRARLALAPHRRCRAPRRKAPRRLIVVCRRLTPYVVVSLRETRLWISLGHGLLDPHQALRAWRVRT